MGKVRAAGFALFALAMLVCAALTMRRHGFTVEGVAGVAAFVWVGAMVGGWAMAVSREGDGGS